MIIVHLMGGLGNQLFQYATGRRLSLASGAELKLDIRDYAASEHPYRLDKLNVVERIASDTEIETMLGCSSRGGLARLDRAVRSRLRMPRRRAVVERDCRFDPRALRKRDNIYLDGYWQSEKYFAGVADLLRREFTFKEPPEPSNQPLLDLIARTESVSLHVRRGDYVTNPLFNRVHGTCSTDYHAAAVRFVSDRVNDPHFFVFSDDIDWARENVEMNSPAIHVSHNGESRDYEDLRLMSHCRHHIIANSSFSWWGAWLRRDPGGIVVAPRRWFNDPSRDASDIVPESWERL